MEKNGRMLLAIFLFSALIFPLPASALDSISLNCPLFSESGNVSVLATYSKDGFPSCGPLVLHVIQPDGNQRNVLPDSCNSGVHSFSFPLPESGNYDVTAQLDQLQANCAVGSVLSKRPRRLPELSWASVLLTGFVALAFLRLRK